MTKCISADKLTQYVDGLLEPREHQEVFDHLRDCKECRTILGMLEQENLFLQKTLSAPKLPDSFADNVLAELEPYRSKRKAYWIRGAEIAAAAVLVVGLTSAVSPGFSDFLTSFITQEEAKLDIKEVEKIAKGIIYPVDYVAEADGYQVVVEYLTVEADQVGFVYKVLNKHGKPVEKEVGIGFLYLQEPGGRIIDTYHSSVTMIGKDHEFHEIKLIQFPETDNLVLHADMYISEVDNYSDDKTRWKLEIPIQYKQAREQAQVIDLENKKYEIENHELQFQKMITSPSKTTISYQIAQTEAYAREENEKLAALTDDFASRISDVSSQFSFKLLNEKGELVANLIRSERLEGVIDHTVSHDGIGTHTFHELSIPPQDGPLFMHINGIFYGQILGDRMTFDELSTTLAKPQLKMVGGTYTLTDMKIADEELEIRLELTENAKYFRVTDWLLVDGKGKPFYSMGYGTDTNGQVTITANKQNLQGPYTLIALSGSSYKELPVPVVIELK